MYHVAKAVESRFLYIAKKQFRFPENERTKKTEKNWTILKKRVERIEELTVFLYSSSFIGEV